MTTPQPLAPWYHGKSLKVRRSQWGWTMYAPDGEIVASAGDPGLLVNYAVTILDSDVHVELYPGEEQDGYDGTGTGHHRSLCTERCSCKARQGNDTTHD